VFVAHKSTKEKTIRIRAAKTFPTRWLLSKYLTKTNTPCFPLYLLLATKPSMAFPRKTKPSRNDKTRPDAAKHGLGDNDKNAYAVPMPLSYDEHQMIYASTTAAYYNAAATMNNPGSAGNYPVPLLIQTSSQDNARKRQRRQTAGNLVMGALFRNDSGSQQQQSTASPASASSSKPKSKPKKSTAQPRPDIHIPPRGIGPVRDPNPNDVLSGRGGRINAHVSTVL